MIKRLIAAAQSKTGRLFAIAMGLLAVTLILRNIGLRVVAGTLLGAASAFPIIVTLEAGVLACTMRALRSLYGEAGHTVPTAQYVRAGLIGYAVMGIVPAGRSFAEVARATMLAPYVGGPRAAASAARLQGVALLANALISVPTIIAAGLAVGWSFLPLAIAGNLAVTLTLGIGILVAGRKAGLGARLGRRMKSAHGFGVDFDALLEGEPLLPLVPIGWELAGRVLQVMQNAVLIVAVGGALGLRGALVSEGILLVGAAVGDLVPAQLGAIEANFTLSARALALPASAAVSIALLAHLVQLTWVVVGSLVPLLWPARGQAHGGLATTSRAH
jgi:hypothetical protein